MTHKGANMDNPTQQKGSLALQSRQNREILRSFVQHGEYMEKNIRSRVLAIGRPLRVELQLDGEWLDRLRKLLQEMGEEGGAYPLHRYLEELLEADIVYRESDHTRRRGPFVQREAIIRWLREQRNMGNSRTTAASKP
jgi:hypothetical protein